MAITVACILTLHPESVMMVYVVKLVCLSYTVSSL